MFTSDNFPGKYQKNTDCWYHMKAAEGRRVQLTFFGQNTKNIQVTSKAEELSFNLKTDGVQESMG